MNNPLFVKVKESVIQWIKDKKEFFISKNIMTETVENTEDRLYVIFNFVDCIAAIVVAEPDFAPYRFVSFEVAALVDEKTQGIYFWYDKEGTGVSEIIEQIEKGIEFALCYKKRINSI